MSIGNQHSSKGASLSRRGYTIHLDITGINASTVLIQSSLAWPRLEGGFGMTKKYPEWETKMYAPVD